jgi:hypothetical protein
MHVAKIFVVGDLADGGHQGEKARGPQVVLVTQRRAENVSFFLSIVIVRIGLMA